MIRSKKQYEELAAVKIIPVYKTELNARGMGDEEKLEEVVSEIAV